MRRKSVVFAISVAAIAAATLYYAQIVRATPANAGFTTTYILKGATFSPFLVFDRVGKRALPAGNNDRGWFDFQMTKGHSDLYVVNNTWQAVNFDGNHGIASTGWHTHPGPSLITVTAGTLTEYHDNCIPHVHNTGDTFVDSGGGEVHLIRNEGSVAASTIAVQLVPYDPAKGNRRIDVPAPSTCANLN